MTITEIIATVEARARFVQQALTLATADGDLARVTALEAELAETEATLARLRSLA